MADTGWLFKFFQLLLAQLWNGKLSRHRMAPCVHRTIQGLLDQILLDDQAHLLRSWWSSPSSHILMIKTIFSKCWGWSRSDLIQSRSDLDHFYSFPKVGLSSSLYFIGLMIGSVVTGGLADVWGRRPILLVSCDGDHRWSQSWCCWSGLAWDWIQMFELLLLLGCWKPWPNLSPLGYDHLDFSILCCGCILSRVLVLLNIQVQPIFSNYTSCFDL